MCSKEKEGILLVDKPSGMTSHDVVGAIRKRFHIKKVGHAGTLDPMATGLLIILLGRFTKAQEKFLNYDKSYEACLKLGVSTDSGDADGKITEEKETGLSSGDAKRVEEAVLSFSGEISQVPPMYSAKKIKGKKLYELARKGVTVKREPRKVVIKEIKVTDISFPNVTFYTTCSKGTYIRQLGIDIAGKIGCGGHLTSLRRTAIGPFDVNKAVAFNELVTEGTGSAQEEKLYENILQPE